MVRKGGLEPPQGEPHKILNLARLPIPPLSHTGGSRMVDPGRTGVKANCPQWYPDTEETFGIENTEGGSRCV